MKHNAKTLCPECPDMVGRPAYLLGRSKECKNYDPSLDNKILGFFGEYRFLSSFWLVPIVYEHVVYPSVEHAYQAAKSPNLLIKKNISEMRTPGEAKRAGKVLYRPDWHDIKLKVMENLVRKKFEDPVLRIRLLETGNMYLEETNTWRDTFWGVCNGVGENNLGKILMKIRGEINEG